VLHKPAILSDAIMPHEAKESNVSSQETGDMLARVRVAEACAVTEAIGFSEEGAGYKTVMRDPGAFPGLYDCGTTLISWGCAWSAPLVAAPCQGQLPLP
jgi:hypothetical protein